MRTIQVVSHPPLTIRLTGILLACGVLSSLWYLAINIYVPTQYPGYSVVTYTVSELSAIDAPTRTLWVALVVLYPILFALFGIGVMRVAGDNRSLRWLGMLIVGYSLFNIYWPPMHQRGLEPTLTDTLHITWAVITVTLMITLMVIGAVALDRRFRILTITAIALHILFGMLTFVEAPNIATNGPTPTIGIWERINIAVFMWWVVILALHLRKERLR